MFISVHPWPKNRPLWRIAAAMLLLASFALITRSAYLHAKAELAGVLIRRAWQQTLRDGTHHRPWDWADTHPIARLRIARLGFDEIVLEGATPRTLAFGPARLRSGAAPGEAGNILIAGHRTTWFEPIEAVAVGDTIELEWRGTHGPRRRAFIVESTHITAPDDPRLTAPSPHDALTLLTCYPFGSGYASPQRYIVRARPLVAASQ